MQSAVSHGAITCNRIRIFYAMVIVEEMHRKRDYVSGNLFYLCQIITVAMNMVE